MSNVIYGNMVGGGSAPLKTLILTDENGREVVGVVTENVQVFDATPADVRINKTFVSDNGVSVGKNTITYRTEQGSYLIFPGDEFGIFPVYKSMYDYTKLQCIISKFNTSVYDSVITDKISIGDSVYHVNSLNALSSITKDSNMKFIDLNIVNDTEETYIIHYFTYTEEY